MKLAILWTEIMNIVYSAPRISYCILGPPFAAIMITNKFRGMVNKNTVALVIDSGAIVFGKTNSKIMLPEYFSCSVDPFRRPTPFATEKVNRIGCNADKLNMWILFF